MRSQDTITLAHTARCKLQLAADRPDRNLRFILGHAFTLDRIRVAVAEIEDDSDDDDGVDESLVENQGAQQRRVSFGGRVPGLQRRSEPRRRSPPPDQISGAGDSDTASDDDDAMDDDLDAEDAGLSLQRFPSGTAQPPRAPPELELDDSSSSEDENEPKSPPPLTNDELLAITGGKSSEELTDVYKRVAGCGCHGKRDLVGEGGGVWEVPKTLGGGRRAVVQVS